MIEREDHVALKERREGHGVWGERRERITQLWRSEQKRTTQFRRREDHEVLGEKGEDHVIRGEKREDHLVLECSFLPRRLGRRDTAGRKVVKGLLLMDQEKVPCGFGLRTGDQVSETTDGSGN